MTPPRQLVRSKQEIRNFGCQAEASFQSLALLNFFDYAGW
jgi:hypothetical protein